MRVPTEVAIAASVFFILLLIIVAFWPREKQRCPRCDDEQVVNEPFTLTNRNKQGKIVVRPDDLTHWKTLQDKNNLALAEKYGVTIVLDPAISGCSYVGARCQSCQHQWIEKQQLYKASS